ncbi:MAG: hypothetical protein EZS28_013969 [Streblomastix strix]|uniref:Uncharacterized protein n=1 Tax=Streblomastix strix TaxID=222440 RepID=A0A5J4W6U5_9EUKA|nr:MAG: hypothetical protein EZS28_013969 [Streblomastix strix]
MQSDEIRMIVESIYIEEIVGSIFVTEKLLAAGKTSTIFNRHSNSNQEAKLVALKMQLIDIKYSTLNNDNAVLKNINKSDSSSTSSDSSITSVKPTEFTRELEKDTAISKHNFKPLEFQFSIITMDDDKREISRVKSVLLISQPSKVWKDHEKEDTIDARSYSAAVCRAILVIGYEIAKQDKRIFKKHKKKFISAY